MVKLKIIYLIDRFETNYPRDQNYIIRYFMERGHDVTVVTSKNPYFEKYDRLMFSNAKFLRGRVLGQIRSTTIYLHPNMFRYFFEEYDVIHSFTFFTFSSLFGAILKSDVKIIRSEIGSLQGETFWKSINYSAYRTFVDIYKKFYDYITVYNSIEAEALVTLGFEKNKILEVKPMIDFDTFSALRREPVSIDDGSEVIVGTIARISKEKGIHRLVKIFEKMNDSLSRNKIKFLLAGRIEDACYFAEVYSRLKELLGEKFEYLGEIAPPYNFYKTVDVVVVPSLTETGAIVVLEAMAAGKVVLASNIYPINLYIDHGYNGFLFKNSQEAAKVLEAVVENYAEIKKISLNAQKVARQYDYRIVCRKLEQVYLSSPRNIGM